VPAVLQLVYLGNGELLRYEPDEADLLATERKVDAIWRAIRECEETRTWRPRRSRLCSWCSYQEHCPEFGGTTLPLPDPVRVPPPSSGAGAGTCLTAP
jgi:putative RecB family exonuclease